jgi:hypothetical protein
MRTPIIAGAVALCLSLPLGGCLTLKNPFTNQPITAQDIAAGVKGLCFLNANLQDIKALQDAGIITSISSGARLICDAFDAASGQRMATRKGGARTLNVVGFPVRVSPTRG